jgi:hypothetical protein
MGEWCSHTYANVNVKYMTSRKFPFRLPFPFHPGRTRGKVAGMSTALPFPIASFGALALAAVMTCPSQAHAWQDDDAPAFSILAPAADAETEEAPPAELPQAERADAPAGPWLDRAAYLAARGERSEDVLRTRWRIETASLDGTPQGSEQREIVIGDGYVTEPGDEANTVQDFATGRLLTRIQSLDGPVMRNLPIVAHAHRQMNTFAYYTQGGELDEVTGPGGSLFERFWIEAAMGVRLTEVEMETSEGEDGHVTIRRFSLGSEIFGFDPDGTGSLAQAGLFRAWMRHALPVHPDALNRMPASAGIPERFSFLVFSPTSPDGRRETWTRLNTSTGSAAFPWPENVPPAPAVGYDVSDPTITRLLAAGLEAMNGPMAAAPTEATFVAASQAAQRRADPAGAYLALYQVAHHSGPCRPQSQSAVCSRMSQVTAAGLGNAEFEALMTALSDMQDDREAAIARLRTHLHREGFAGAAANMLTAQAVAAEQAANPEALPELSPLALFAASAEADPYAPLTYWHAGRYAAGRGDVESAWLLFDIAVGLPGSDALPPTREAVAMREQLRTLAPGFFGPEATR